MIVSSTCIFHKSNEEITTGIRAAVTKVCLPTRVADFTDLYSIFIQALRKYREHNGSLPGRIIMFRDGVGDGQIEYVRNSEIKEVKAAFQDQGDMKFTYIIVSKRVNNR